MCSRGLEAPHTPGEGTEGRGRRKNQRGVLWSSGGCNPLKETSLYPDQSGSSLPQASCLWSTESPAALTSFTQVRNRQSGTCHAGPPLCAPGLPGNWSTLDAATCLLPETEAHQQPPGPLWACKYPDPHQCVRQPPTHSPSPHFLTSPWDSIFLI